MIRIDIRPVWTFRGSEAREFDFLVISLLEGLERTGKLTRAAEHAGISYRHAWNLIEIWSRLLGSPLVIREKGRGSTLSELGANLLWAGKRAQSRLEPELESLASEFSRALNDTLFELRPGLDLHASHDFAVALLARLAGNGGITIDTQYTGSFEALARLKRGECDIAGFHLPVGPLGATMARRYAECLTSDLAILGFVSRRQGFIVRSGNPKEITSIQDLTRNDVRMINRQRGSGTRSLLEHLLDVANIDRRKVRGYSYEESTHSAVAALIAGNQADVGLGTEAAGVQYGLGFVPLCVERYFFAVRESLLESPAVSTLLSIARSDVFAAALAGLPGYELDNPGEHLGPSEALSLHDLPVDAVRIPT